MDVKLHLNLEMEKEEAFWEQRAQVNWLKNGDRNTTFFDKFASQRRRWNRIQSLIDENKNKVFDSVLMQRVAKNYFTSLFSTGDVSDLEHILSGVNTCISAELNSRLITDYIWRNLIRH